MSKKNKSLKQSNTLILDEEALRSLKIIADRLPQIPVLTKDNKGIPEYTAMFGSQLIEQGHTEMEGRKIVPGKRYNVRTNKDQVVYINHLNELKRIFLQHGSNGVDNYVKETNLKIK